MEKEKEEGPRGRRRHEWRYGRSIETTDDIVTHEGVYITKVGPAHERPYSFFSCSITYSYPSQLPTSNLFLFKVQTPTAPCIQSRLQHKQQGVNTELLFKNTTSSIPPLFLPSRSFFSSSFSSSKTKTSPTISFASLFLDSLDSLPHKPIFPWDSLIEDFTRKHRFVDAILIFKKLLHLSFHPHVSNFPPLIKSFSLVAAPSAGFGLHGFIIKYGVLSSRWVSTSLVSMYVKFGGVRDAVQLFEEMPIRDAFLYNFLIWEFGLNGFHEEVLMVFEQMQALDFSPDLGSVARAILACGELGCVRKGALIHHYVCRHGFGSHVEVVNSLISMYTKVNRLDEARSLFNDMPKRDLVSWNSMILGYARSGNWVETFHLFRSMKVENFGPNRITFLGLILACGQAEDLVTGKSIHGHLICAGLLRDVRVGTSVVDMYSKCGRADCAHEAFEELQERSLVSWNALVVGYSQNGYDYEAVDLFRRMLRESNIKPDSITIANVVPACASLAELQRIQSVHGFIVKKGFGLYSDVVLGTAMVDAYSKCLDIEAACFLFSCIERPNTATWNAMISGYNINGQPCRGLQVFLVMLQGEVLPDLVTLVTVLQSCGQIGSLKLGMLFHGYCFCRGFDSYVTVVNAMIDMYIRCGCIKNAQLLFNSMTMRNTVTWNSMLCGSVKMGLSAIALKLFRKMLLEDEHKPDQVTMISIAQSSAFSVGHGEMIHGFVLKIGLDSDTLVTNSLIDSYAKNGSINNAWSLFEQMGHSRDQTSWNVMIAGCGINGQGQEAFSLIPRMEEDGFRPNSITFISLLSSCSHCGMLDEGRQSFDLMTEKYGIRPSLEHYTCMIDMFGRAGRLEEAYRLIKSMPEGSDCDVVWGALLSACKLRMNVELGQLAGEQLSRLAPNNCGYHTLLSNVYASAERWDEAAKAREVFEDGRIIKKPGLSVMTM